MYRTMTRRAAAAAVLALALFGAACSDSTGTKEEEPEIATMRLTIGASTVNVSSTGAVTGGPLVIPRGTTSTITASFLRADGSADPLVTSAKFRLQVTTSTGVTGITFANATPNGLNGTFTTAANATGGTIRFALLHIAENHEDFGPFPVTVQVP